MNEPLNESILTAAIQTNWLGKRFEYLPVIDSTNDNLRDRLTTHSGMLMPHGMRVITDFQTRGRGRMNRRWLSPPNVSLMFSLLFRVGWPAEQANWLTMLAGIAAANAIRNETNLDVMLKWPNDLIIVRHNEWYKLGGILLECEFSESGKLQQAILGMGINVNVAPESLPPQPIIPATSILAATGMPVSRPRLLNLILRELERGFSAAAQGQSPQPAWKNLLVTLGQRVTITTNNDAEPITGLAETTDEWGHLLIRTDSGELHTVTAGDVGLRK